METRGRRRALSHQQDEPEENPGKRPARSASLHCHRDHPNANSSALERHHPRPSGRPPAGTVQPKPAQSPQPRSLLDRDAIEHITELWDRLYLLRQSLEKMTMADGLKPLKHFRNLEELLSLGGERLLQDLVRENQHVRSMMNEVTPLLREDGSCSSLNYQLQPVIGVIYGPTGCGKSQLLRNLLSSQLINPPPETVFFIAPQVDMIPPSEIKAWEMQICEGNYAPGPEGTIIPQSGTLLPRFVKMAYDELTLEQNYDVSHPNNIFAKAAAKGPIAIIMDECMENLGGHKGVSKFFHAFPSKLHDKFPKCTGYTVLVVLHNMNPRRDLGGNIANLKIQAKMHLISPACILPNLIDLLILLPRDYPWPLACSLRTYFSFMPKNPVTTGLFTTPPPSMTPSSGPTSTPRDGLMPMYLNIQAHLYRVLENIHKVLNDRDRWSRAYRKRNK
ncbi:IVa2 [Human adenovirus 41]|nr:IVa2 [Human adenovirus 41]